MAMIAILFILLGLTTGIIIFLYVKSSFQLLEDIERKVPKVWESLGRPKKVHVRGGSGSRRSAFDTIQPIFPWLVWICKGDTSGLPLDISYALLKTRRLLFVGLALFITVVVFFLILAKYTA